MSFQKSNNISPSQYEFAVRKRHDLGPKENYLIEIDLFLERIDKALQKLALQIKSQEKLDAASAAMVNRLKYYQGRLIDLKTVLNASDTVQLEVIKAEAGLLFERVEYFFKA